MTVCRIQRINERRPNPRTCPTCGISGRCALGLTLDGESKPRVAWVVACRVRWEGDSIVAVWRTEAEAIGLRNRLNRRCDTTWCEYVVYTVPLEPDPVAMSREISEVAGG